jgi:hypothetical protein
VHHAIERRNSATLRCCGALPASTASISAMAAGYFVQLHIDVMRRGCPGGGIALEQRAEREEIVEILVAPRFHLRTLIALNDDEILGGESPQRLANRRAADATESHQLGLFEARVRRKGTIEDSGTNGGVRAIGSVTQAWPSSAKIGVAPVPLLDE